MISVTSSSKEKASRYLNSLNRGQAFALLERYGQMGVDALASATPIETGLTAQSWRYEVIRRRGRYSIIWSNTNTVSGVNVVILIQYGHGTRGGTWVEGRDFINPVIRPLFDRIADEVWRGVTRG